MIRTGPDRRTAIVEGFAAYLAQGYACAWVVSEVGPEYGTRVVPVASDPHLPWRLARGEEPEPASSNTDGQDPARGAVGVIWLGSPRSRETKRQLERVPELLKRMPVILLAAEAPTDLEGFTRRLRRRAIRPTWVGYTPGPDPAALAIIEADPHLDSRPASEFRVLAIVPAFNEADVIDSTLSYLIHEGVDVYLLDNWSTDTTTSKSERWLGGGLIEIERFPPEGPSATYDLQRLLARVEEIASERSADWYILHDADERRRGPWPGLGLREALWRVDQRGFTCVDHVTLNFWPTNDGFDERRDVEDQLRYFEFSTHIGHFHQRRAWKKFGGRVALSTTAGHDAAFPDRRVEPFKFLLKHFPIRSQAHGERKILRERLPRFDRQERAAGWHAQYDEMDPTRFTRDPAELRYFDSSKFYSTFLVERLSGLGIFQDPPWWATPAR